MSPLSARRAEQLGYKNVRVFTTGLPSWKKAKNIVVSEPSYIKSMRSKGMPVVVIDLREPTTASAGHIPGAVNIPAKKLVRYKDDFPKQMSAPIILYTDKGADAEAFATVRRWGYKNTSVLINGFAGWTSSKGNVMKAQLAAKITYVPKMMPGTISAKDFKKAIKATDKVIVDVRDISEAQAGMLPGAVNIPLADISGRLGELPKEKELILHCTTGIRAQIAYDTLKKKGYNARYLSAVMQVAADGSYEIEE